MNHSVAPKKYRGQFNQVRRFAIKCVGEGRKSKKQRYFMFLLSTNSWPYSRSHFFRYSQLNKDISRENVSVTVTPTLRQHFQLVINQIFILRFPSVGDFTGVPYCGALRNTSKCVGDGPQSQFAAPQMQKTTIKELHLLPRPRRAIFIYNKYEYGGYLWQQPA